MQEQLNDNDRPDQYNQQKVQEIVNEEYTTHINQLISEPATENIYMAAAQYIFSSLYQLSTYLFTKKLNQAQADQEALDSQSELSLYSYLDEMGEELGRFGKIKAFKQNQISKQNINIESELIKCYQKVQSIYFQQKYFLDLSYFELFYVELKSNNKEKGKKVNKYLDKIVESLDLVEINLFSQIHCKFHEYFAAAANFQYLQESVNNQLKKLKESRSRIQLVKRQMVDKSFKLRQMIIKRQNIEKVLKNIKIVKSLKKLPQVIESILASSLPYECLQLLKTTKTSIESVKALKCLTNTSESIRNMQSLAQNDLTKRYVNQLYLYLEQCHNQESVRLIEVWKKIEIKNCLDKDSSLIIDELNSSTESIRSENENVLEKLQESELNNGKLGTRALVPRNQGRQYEIAMILLQSFQFITFSPDVIKIKFGNALRIFSKRFQRQLLNYLDSVVRMQIQTRKENERILQNDEMLQPIDKQVFVEISSFKKQIEEGDVSSIVVEKVTVQFYVKHLNILNEIFRDTIERLIGYLYTLISEYEEQYNNKLSAEANDIKNKERKKKFRTIFAEESSLLPSIFKIIQEKIKYLLTLKHIRDITYLQYYQWISILKFWQRFFQNIYENNEIVNYNQGQGLKKSPFHTELCNIFIENIKKSELIMGLRNLLYELTANYIDVYHNNALNNEVINNLQEDTWQSTEVPQEFSDILNNIFNPDGNALNVSITILDLSSASSKGNFSRQSSRQLSKDEVKDESKVRLKFKLLKNNILVGGVRYKVHLSLIILCETISQYIKMNRKLASIMPNQFVAELGYNKITKYIYEKVFNLIERFVNRSRELILQCQALKFQQIKVKTINAKHICLLCNSYSILLKISEEILQKRRLDQFQLQNVQTNIIVLLTNTHSMLTNKLSVILNSKMDKIITEFIQSQANNTLNQSMAAKINNSIVTGFIQMVEITDDYLQAEDIKKVLKNGFQTLTQKYFTHLISKGEKYKGDIQLLAQKLKFLRKYFVLEYESLLKQIQK